MSLERLIRWCRRTKQPHSQTPSESDGSNDPIAELKGLLEGLKSAFPVENGHRSYINIVREAQTCVTRLDLSMAALIEQAEEEEKELEVSRESHEPSSREWILIGRKVDMVRRKSESVEKIRATIDGTRMPFYLILELHRQFPNGSPDPSGFMSLLEYREKHHATIIRILLELMSKTDDVMREHHLTWIKTQPSMP